MFIIEFTNSCLKDLQNRSNSRNNCTTNKIYGTSLVTLTTMAFVFNGFSMIILTRKNSNLRFGQIKLNLLLLSLVETCLTGFITLFHLIIQNKHSPNAGGLAALWIETILFYNITSLICTRNWIVVIIACSRCEIIFLPLNSRRGLKFNHHNTKLIALIMLLFSYCLAFVRLFSKKAFICEDLLISIQAPYLMDYQAYVWFEIYCFFIYQSVLPVVIVTIVSMSMSISLLHQTRFSSSSSFVHNCSYYQINHPTDQRIYNRKISSQRKATRTILVLALVFTLLEGPVFIAQSFMHSAEYRQYQKNQCFINLLNNMCNLLVVLDSCSNIVVYLLTSDKFRLEVRRFFWQMNSCQLCDNNNYLLATEHLVIHQNNVLALLTALPLSSRSNPSSDKELDNK